MFNKKRSDSQESYHSHAVIEKKLSTYEVKVLPAEFNGEQANDLVTKIIRMMRKEHLSYKTAMQIPALLQAALSISFQQHMEDSLVKPLFDDGNNQSNERNDKCED